MIRHPRFKNRSSFCTDMSKLVDVDVYSNKNEEISLLTLTQAIVNGLEAANLGSFVRIESATGAPIFRRMPGAAPSLQMRAVVGRKLFMLVDENPGHIMLDGVRVALVDGGAIRDEESFQPFLEFIDQQMRMWTVMGTADGVANVNRIKEWFQQLQSFLSSVELQAVDDGDLSIMSRARRVQRSIRKRQGSIIGRILEMESGDRVNRLNAQQQADWLRRATDNRSGRDLARRAVANADGGELNYNAVAQTAIQQLCGLPPVVANDGGVDDEPVSFYSMSSGTDGLEAARELRPVIGDLTSGDVIQVLGLVGVPFEAPVGNYTDPYGLRIRRLFAGQSLSEQDVWVVRSATKDAFACPGVPGSNITGVIALRRNNPAAYDTMTLSRALRGVFEMQVSAQLRHTIAVIPGDAVALNTAGVWSLMQTFGAQGRLMEVERELACALQENITHLIGSVYPVDSYQELYDSVRTHADVRPWLSGDRSVSSILKVFAVLLRFYKPGVDTTQLANIFRACYYFDCYMAAKRVCGDLETRAALLRSTLGYEQTKSTPLSGVMEPNDANPVHNDSITIETVHVHAAFPDVRPYCALWSWLTNERGTALMSPSMVFGGALDGETLRATAAVQALCCATESDRINTATRTCVQPDPLSREEAEAYLRGILRGLYKTDYEKRLACKTQEENELKLQHHVQELSSVSITYDAFKELLLQGALITNRDSKGYGQLYGALLMGDVTTVDRLRKLTLLCCGREVHAPGVTVWCNGNFMLQGWAELERVFDHTAEGKEMMAGIRAMRKRFGVHKYRGCSNRHGHSDAFPSFWAMGYRDLFDMRSRVSLSEFVRYLDQHCRTRGCCMPNEGPERERLGLAQKKK